MPRGGVPVAFEVAQALAAPLDVILVRKIGAPRQKELEIGAVVDGAHPHIVLNEDVVRAVEPGDDYIRQGGRARDGGDRARRALYRPNGRRSKRKAARSSWWMTASRRGKIKAVLKALRELHPRTLVLAVPVAPADSLAEVAPFADEVVALAIPEPFYAVGAYYRDFTQTGDEEVVDLLARANPKA